MTECIVLGPTELVQDRLFTNPERNLDDQASLIVMLGRLRQVLSRPEALPDGPRPAVLNLMEPDGRTHRIAISGSEELLAGEQFTIVGFFGEKWPAADLSVLEGVDLELIHHFPLHPGVLSYSTLELQNGDSGNLVVLSRPDIIEDWRTNIKHSYAAEYLAPKYYAHIRLHNYFLPGGLMAGLDPILLRTKYYDYGGGGVWLALREVDSSLRSHLPRTQVPGE